MADRISKQCRKHKPVTGLPPVLQNEPFSLIGTLRRTRSLLTVEDVCEILQCKKATVYKHIKEGKIPPADLGFDLLRIDPKAWADRLEPLNPHLVPSVRTRRAA